MSGKRDSFGGFTIGIDQFHWGHRAEKRTLLYVVGCAPSEVPSIPIRLGRAPRVVTNQHGLRQGMLGYRPEITKSEREATPPALAEWLVELARRCAGRAQFAEAS